jgi:hypothetical protein
MSLQGGEHRRKFGDLLIEVLLISIGVFLALWASNWHENREHKTQARAALQNFLGEMEANRAAVQKYRQYHETLAQELGRFLESPEAPTMARFKKEVDFRGLQPVIFEHTAWDLALATQALSYLKSDLAFDISKIYTQQNAFQTLENSFLASAFTPASLSSDNREGLAIAMQTYLNDVNTKEPQMLSLYDKVIPELKSALEGKP